MWLLIILGVVFLFIFFKLLYNHNFLYDVFSKNSVIVFGYKGKGKDLIFQKIINMRVRKKKMYASNIDYTNGKNFLKTNLKALSVEPNTFEHFLHDSILTIEKNNDLEGTDVFISDAGIYLPSHEDARISKIYRSLPIFYALSRHLYNMNIHTNTQIFTRLWVKLREQAGGFVRALKTFKLGPFLFTKVRYYSEVQSAENNVLPFAKSFFNNFNKGLYEEFVAKHGLVKDFYIVQLCKNVKYDTRAFHTKVFGVPFKKQKTAK